MKNENVEPVFESIKKFKKDQPRQIRRKSALSRLETNLKSGTKTIQVENKSLDMGAKPGQRLIVSKEFKKVPLEETDVKRINSEINKLKSRL